jgi:hypothetical protein
MLFFDLARAKTNLCHGIALKVYVFFYPMHLMAQKAVYFFDDGFFVCQFGEISFFKDFALVEKVKAWIQIGNKAHL